MHKTASNNKLFTNKADFFRLTWIRRPAILTMCIAMAACSSGSGTTGSGQVNFVLGPVSGASCNLFNNSGTLLAGPTSTQTGTAVFNAFPASVGLGLLVCSGGNYTDEATGVNLVAPQMRSYVSLGANPLRATVTPLTEMAVRLTGTRDPNLVHKDVAKNVAGAFGLTDIDINAEVPLDLNNNNAGNSNAGRYGIVLAALSQLQMQSGKSKTALDVVTQLTAGMSADGYFTDTPTRTKYSAAMQAMLGNNRLAGRLSSADGQDVFRDLFDKISHEHMAAVVDYVDTDDSATQSGEPSSIVVSNNASSIAIVGRNLYLNMRVTLGSTACKVHDLQPLDNSEGDSEEDVITADCPAKTAGNYALIVMDKDEVAYKTTIVSADAPSNRPTVASPSSKTDAYIVGMADATVNGIVTAQAPTILTTAGARVGAGGLDYSTPRTFNVRGVVVELLNRNAGDAVLATSSTDALGRYSFSGVSSDLNVAVRVKAQIVNTRDAGQTAGAQYNFTLRDNTSTSTPKALFTLDSLNITTVAGVNTVNLQAAMGFDAVGNVTGPRQSAVFSILEVVYSAVDKLRVVDPNVTMPDLNIYWSADNVDAPGDKNKGQIETSHYASGGSLPGVFILGKANVDTDEFDQGVIGHEFGHYLQSALSYSDSPGGSHSSNEYKDASLAYGEGYGTAVGGLLAGSPYYTDSKGDKQANGSVTDMSKPSSSTEARGFYAENSIAYVMYSLGTSYGFNNFWRAVISLKSGHASATIFSFLNQYLAITTDPSARTRVAELMAQENIRNTNLLGALNGTADPAVDSAASKGATDLETLYTLLSLGADTVGDKPIDLTPNSTPFCINANLKGANKGNGLGMSRRFTFTASFSGPIGLRATDDKGAFFAEQSTGMTGRDSTGSKVQMYGWSDGYAQITVVQGRTYTVKVNVTDPQTILGGNRCNNRLSLWRLPV